MALLLVFNEKSLQGIPQPAELGDVDDDAVGTAQLDLSIAGALASARLAVPSCSFEGRQPGGPRLLHPLGACENVVYDEADVVNAAEIFPCSPTSGSSRFLQARMVKFRSPSLR